MYCIGGFLPVPVKPLFYHPIILFLQVPFYFGVFRVVQLFLSQNLICFRPNDETNPYFVKAFLESPVGMSYLTSSQAGSVLTALNVKDLETIKIPDISASEQNEIGWIIKKADTDLQEALQKAKNEYVEKYKEIYQHMRLTEAFNLIEE